MKAEQWQRISDLFHAALEREPDERAAFLAQACAGDEGLRREVESLIASHEPSDSFIESLAPDLAAGLLAESRARLVTGQAVGHYKVMSLLGAGGMGEVYLAQDTRLGRRVALKLLPAQFTREPDRLHRFEREDRAASSLNHPNIITIHEVGRVEGAPFIITEFIEGQTLRQQMASAKMRLREAFDVAIQVASALEAAHKAGIVHRDIKPENIMLRPDGLVKVLDFGLAKLTEANSPAADAEATTLARVQTKTGMVMGTVSYMSPEQARGLAVDARSDTFSLGVVLYEMIAGRVPFDGATTSDVIVSILEREPVPLSRHAPEVPAELERIVKKALAKDREERYQLAKDLLIDLRNLKQEMELRAKLGAAGQVDSNDVASATTHKVQPSVDTDGKSVIQTGEVESARTASSVEYLVGKIKGHKGVSALGLIALVIAIAAIWMMTRPKPSASDGAVKSIAVLPFKPLVAGNRDESLELGMAETLINKLSGIRQLIVRPISSVRKYTALEQDSIAAGRELGVDYVLEGNLQMDGDKTRATVLLLSVKDGSAAWTDKCDEQCSTIFELQDAIAERIAASLAPQLTDKEKSQLAKRYTDNPEAFRLYSQGRYYLFPETRERFEKSIEYFERAIELDPNYALAYAGLARVYGTIGLRGFWTPKKARQKAEEAALMAVRLDDTLAEAHASLGQIKKGNFDWAGAEKEFKRAVELDPNSTEAHFLYSTYLMNVGRMDEALVYARRADELNLMNPNPSNPGFNQAAFIHLNAREYDKAIELILNANPKRAQGNRMLAECYLGKGMYDQAIAEIQKLIARNNAPERWDHHPLLAYAYAMSGRRDEALKILDEQKRLAKQRYISPFNFAVIYTGLGDKDKAFDYLNKALDEGMQMMWHFRGKPLFDSLRSGLRYAELLRRMNLAP